MEIGDTHSVEPNLAEFKRPEKPPPYFGIDIDGTFYTRNEEAMERNIEAFAEVKKKGYTPFFCTGRSVGSSLTVMGPDFIEKTGYRGYPGVYNNGSLVYDKNGRVIYSKGFRKEFVEKLGKFLIEKSFAPNVVFYTEHGACSLSPLYERLMKFSLMRKLPIPSVVTLDDLLSKNVLIIKYAEIDITLSGLCEHVDYTRTITLSDWLYTINPVGINKALGLKELLKHFNAKPEDCGFVGDGDNDIEAMDFCDPSFCVNGRPYYINRHAKWVLDKTCDEGAVAEALELVYGSPSP